MQGQSQPWLTEPKFCYLCFKSISYRSRGLSMHMQSKCLPVLNVPRPNIYIPENTRLNRNWPRIAPIPCCQMVPFSMIYPFDDMRKLKNNLHQMVYSRLFFFYYGKFQTYTEVERLV